MSWKKPVPPVGYRHTLGLTEPGQDPSLDRRFEMLDLVHRMYVKTRATLSAGQEYPYFVLTGPTALGVMSGQNTLLEAKPDLVFIHGTRSQTMPFLRHHLAQSSQTQTALMEELAARAQFPNFTNDEFAGSALDMPLDPASATPNADRGLRVMTLAALQSATVSRVQIRRGAQTEFRELPMPHPSGVLLLAIARYGHTKAVLIEVSKRLSYTEGAPLTPAERDAGTKVRAQLARDLNTRREEIFTVLAHLTNRKIHHSTGGYKVVGECIQHDPDVEALIGLTVLDLPKTTAASVRTKLSAMDAETKAHLDERASFGTAPKTSSRGTTRSRSPRGH